MVHCINNQPVNWKRFIAVKYTTEKYIAFSGLFLKNWNDGNQTLNDIIRGTYIYNICTTEYENIL